MLSYKGICPNKSEKLSAFGYDIEDQEKYLFIPLITTKNSDTLKLFFCMGLGKKGDQNRKFISVGVNKTPSHAPLFF